ncbi:MAG: hypothetical protein AAFQ87_22175, partial [Bacteroidota bacterium]
DEISFLYRQLKAFCEAEALQQSPFLQRSLRLRQLNDRGLDRLYEIERKAATKLLDEQAPDQEERYKFELEWATLDNEHFGRRQARTLDDSLAHKLRAMEVYFLTLLLRESGEALNRQHILSVDYELPLLSPLLSYLSEERQAYREKPLIELYFLICKSLQTEATDEDYQNLLLGLRRHRSQLSVAVARTMYKYAQNFCIRQINRGQERYQQALFDLFQELLREEVILKEGELAHTDFKNIVTVGLRVKALDWVAGFIDRYHQQVALPFRDNVYAYCQAALSLEQGQAQAAIRLLQQISHTDVHYQISARQLLLKIYYHREDYEATLYTISAFRHFVQRNKELPPTRKTYHLQFLKLSKALCLLRERMFALRREEAEARLQKFREKLDAAGELANRSWLEDECQKLGEELGVGLAI